MNVVVILCGTSDELEAHHGYKSEDLAEEGRDR